MQDTRAPSSPLEQRLEETGVWLPQRIKPHIQILKSGRGEQRAAPILAVMKNVRNLEGIKPGRCEEVIDS